MAGTYSDKSDFDPGVAIVVPLMLGFLVLLVVMALRGKPDLAPEIEAVKTELVQVRQARDAVLNATDVKLQFLIKSDPRYSRVRAYHQSECRWRGNDCVVWYPTGIFTPHETVPCTDAFRAICLDEVDVLNDLAAREMKATARLNELMASAEVAELSLATAVDDD